MDLKIYKSCVLDGSKKSYINIIQSLIDEYYKYAFSSGFINSSNCNKFTSYINNLRVIFDSSLGGDAKVDGSTITINPNRLFRTDISPRDSEINATEIIFHELSHVMNSFHDDYLLGNDGVLDIFCDKFHVLARSKFNLNIERNFDQSDPRNFDKYSFYAIRLLDEAVAQDVAEELMAKKYGYKRDSKNHMECLFGVDYKTNFNYYGFFQVIADKFAKTLAGVGSLNDLSKLSFYENVPYKIVSEYIERPDSFMCLYNELCYMGMMLYSLYVNDGHGNKNAIMPDCRFIQDSYYRLLKLLDDGYEERSRIHTPAVIVDSKQKTIRW